MASELPPPQVPAVGAGRHAAERGRGRGTRGRGDLGTQSWKGFKLSGVDEIGKWTCSERAADKFSSFLFFILDV